MYAPAIILEAALNGLLLGAVYVVLIAVVVAAKVPALIALVAVMFVVQVLAADKIGLRAMGAHEVSPQEAPELHAIIERLCVQADLPKPKVGMVRTSMPNAFAMGRNQKSATVVVTTGIMELLSPAELEGVIAHELGHVAGGHAIRIYEGAGKASAISILSLVLGGLAMAAGAGDADVQEPSFLLDLLQRTRRRAVRDEVFLHADEEHDGELEPLGVVQRHERHGLLRHVALIDRLDRAVVDARHQGRLVQKLADGPARLLLPFGDGGDEFAQVLDPALRLERLFVLECL